ncbi:hypothetical protein CYY_006944 [Polysphondylium violaceum]|uniref:Profilin n=1 Tax=Polysphondylium violaceum TaxID=133409 RepID=A0A8J4PQ97_9MYCE|nr:hypothetical protein CYY_006944 [Polysphondylium violaceum]
MNFQKFVNELLAGSQLSEGAIIEVSSKKVTKSDNLFFEDGELEKIIDLFKQPNDVTTKGIHVDGINYKGSKEAEDDTLYGQRSGVGGVILLQTKAAKLIIVGVYDESIKKSNASKATKTVGDKLSKDGY